MNRLYPPGLLVSSLQGSGGQETIDFLVTQILRRQPGEALPDRRRLQEQLGGEPGGAVLARLEHRPVAGGLAVREESQLRIVQAEVAPEMDGLGAAEALLDHWEDRARREGIPELTAARSLPGGEAADPMEPRPGGAADPLLAALLERGAALREVSPSPEGEDAGHQGLLVLPVSAGPGRDPDGLAVDLARLGPVLTFPTRLGSVPPLLAYARQLLPGYGLEPGDVDRVTLALEETVVNVLQHGYPGCPGTIQVSFARIRGGLRILVLEQGELYPVGMDRPYRPPTPEEPRRPEGLGLHLIQNLVDDAWWRTRRDRTKEFWLIKWTRAIGGAGGDGPAGADRGSPGG